MQSIDNHDKFTIMGTFNNNTLLTSKNTFADLIAPDKNRDCLTFWFKVYFEIEVTTLPSSQKVKERDLNLFIDFMVKITGNDQRLNWTPKFSGEFKNYLKSMIDKTGKRRWGNRTINRIIAHVKTFAKWIDKFPHSPWKIQ